MAFKCISSQMLLGVGPSYIIVIIIIFIVIMAIMEFRLCQFTFTRYRLRFQSMCSSLLRSFHLFPFSFSFQRTAFVFPNLRVFPKQRLQQKKIHWMESTELSLQQFMTRQIQWVRASMDPFFFFHDGDDDDDDDSVAADVEWRLNGKSFGKCMCLTSRIKFTRLAA